MPEWRGHGFVIADDAQGETQTRPPDQPASQEDRRGQRQQHPVDVRLGDVGQDIEPLLPRDVFCTQVMTCRTSSARPRVKITK